ncbi:ATP-dependent DNA helicase RecG [Candidatus Gracilibacteria bacterium]|nr:ATP-dependent DNA helicase RecG [Candidatus Gracilibacteria bacterium]
MSLDFPLQRVLRTTEVHIKKLNILGIRTVRDLLEFFPRATESTEITANFQNITMGAKNTVSGILCDVRQEKTARGETITKAALILDGAVTLEVVWFQTPYILKNLKDESQVFLVGKVDRTYGKVQILNPEVHLNRNVHVGKLRAIYPESPPLTSKWFREKIAGLLLLAKDFVEILPSEILEAENFISKKEAVKQVHAPDNMEMWQKARDRLAFEEIFVIQTRVMREKFLREQDAQNPYLVKFDAEQVKQDLKKIPFQLTTAQKKCLLIILKDFERDRPAHRLMQGDVGSGKTIVSFLSALPILRSGAQVTFLAPTEILAKQHFRSALKFFNPEFSVELLTGSVTLSNKKKIKGKLKNGDIQILIGTHAILTADTEFKNLGFAVIDEQHRFGVEQRSRLQKNHTHLLAMTATPIPRTLALTIYGDQDLCRIDELPPGRKKIITRVISDTKTITKMNLFIDDQIGKDHQIFWVCPLVDESDKIEAKNVKEEFDRIANEVFPKRKVEFLHGRMKGKDKDAIMEKFKNKEFDILVSTSVIEVGVDIPDATVMVIENSERFGLAQLHQFRGRIGRNEFQSYCFLMVGKKDDAQKERLKALERSNDGLYLSEIDLKLRGMGELYGTRQSGLPDLKCADLTDLDLLQSTRDWAINILKQDLTLKKFPALKEKVESSEVYF